MVQLIFEKYALGNWSTHSLEHFYGNVDTEIIKGERLTAM